MDVLVYSLWSAPAGFGGALLGRWPAVRRVPTAVLILAYFVLAFSILFADAKTFHLLRYYSGEGLINGAFFVWLARYLARRPKKEPLTGIIGAVGPASRAFEPRRYWYIARNVEEVVPE